MTHFLNQDKLKKELLFLAFITTMIPTAMAQKLVKTIRIATYNVDGLPQRLNVMGQDYDLNADGPLDEGTRWVSKRLAAENLDIIGLNEDWNFNEAIMSSLSSQYQTGTYRGGFVMDEVKTEGSRIYFATDGLNLLWKKNLSVTDERWSDWKQYYGFMSHAWDSHALKGFRCYTCEIAEGVNVDVYILHMDADEETTIDDIAEDLKARNAQLRQLLADIETTHTGRPKIIMGDTNCSYGQDSIQKILIDPLNEKGVYRVSDAWVEKQNGGEYPAYTGKVRDRGEGEELDKILVLNAVGSRYQLKIDEFRRDLTYVWPEGTERAGQPLCDHWPHFATISVMDTETTGIDRVSVPSVSSAYYSPLAHIAARFPSIVKHCFQISSF